MFHLPVLKNLLGFGAAILLLAACETASTKTGDASGSASGSAGSGTASSSATAGGASTSSSGSASSGSTSSGSTSSGSTSSGSTSSGSTASAGSTSQPAAAVDAADLLANVGDRVLFGFDSSELTSGSQATLNRQAAFLAARPALRITIEGHCDERGTREYNLALGERRASVVRDYLVARGINAARI
ncbi:MAG: OmpA family protein, partial [Alphaproteobacteria bacterium]|nr:OmpA family protein [Alphaproteobacteria bacterium]